MTGTGEFDDLAKSLAPHIAREPRSRATIRVGAVGRRVLEPDVVAHLSATTQAILSGLAAACTQMLARKHIAGTFLPELDLVAISPCAEGADQIVMAAALATHRYRLGAIIPFPLADYRASFDQHEKKTALRQLDVFLQEAQAPHGYGVMVLDGATVPDADRDNAFAQCGTMITHWSDALIAIVEDEARYSMTGREMHAALTDGVPVIHIDPKHPGRYHVLAPAIFGGKPQPGSHEVLEKLAAHLLLSGTSEARARKKESYGLAGYIAEKVECVAEPDFNLERLNVYRVTPAWSFGVRWVPGVIAIFGKLKPKSHFHPKPATELGMPEADRQVYAEICLRQHRADVIANAYAGLHRSVFVVVALISTIAVLLAAWGTQTGVEKIVIFDMTIKKSILLSVVELILIVLAACLVQLARRGSWLERWMDCRLIAEILRYSKFLMLAGRSSPLGRYEPMPDVLNEGNGWAVHYTHAILRARTLSIPGRGLLPRPDAVKTIAKFIDHNCLADQIAYHHRTGPARQRLGERLEILSIGLGLVTLVAVGAKLWLESQANTGCHWIQHESCLKGSTILAIWLPAVAAGLFALKTFGEHELVGMRSARMIVELRHARVKLLECKTVHELGEETSRITQLLLRHVDGWREIFAGKHIHSG